MTSNQTQGERGDTSRARRGKRLVVASVALLVIVCVVGAMAWHLQAEGPNPRPRFQAGPGDVAVSPERKKVMIARAHVIRTKWAVWARQHRAILRRMLHPGKKDWAAFRAVLDAIPPVPMRVSGFRREDLMPNNAEPPTDFSYSWPAIARRARLRPGSPPALRRRGLSGKRQYDKSRGIEYFKHGDIVVSNSLNAGRTRFYLWVSGRITERSYYAAAEYPKIYQRAREEKRPVSGNDFLRSEKEIAGPYEFLRP